MFYAHHKFIFYTLLNILVGVNGLVELPKFEFTDLMTTEEIIRNCTNSVLSSLKLTKPAKFTRISDYATTLHNFLSITFRDSELLNEIARLTRVNKGKYKTDGNLTIINELMERNSCECKGIDDGIEDSDGSVVNYINGFLGKLQELKENFGVNKVFADINSNIIKIFRNVNESYSVQSKFVNSTNDTYENFDIFVSEESGRRIYRGKRTKIKYFPFMASVHIFNTFQCAGSIIKSDIVITASSCLQLAWNNRLYRENPAFLSVRVGSSFYTSGGESIPVLEIYFHPEYNPKNLRNNISLMRLLRHIKFRYSDKRKVRTIAIDSNAFNMPINIPGITIIGWGAKGLSNRLGNPWENILSYDILDVYPLKECQDVYTKEYVTNKNFCAGFFSRGGGACNRDVGAPGVVDGLLMGIVSFGSPVCGTPDVPTVFTKLGYYYHWIKNVMEMEIPRGMRDTTLHMSENTFKTTLYTTTTFKIEPLEPHSKPKSALEEDELSFLRNLDGILFQEYLRTMFGDNESQNYQIKEKKVEEGIKKHNKEKGEISKEPPIDGLREGEVSEQTQISRPVIDKEQPNNKAHQTLSGYAPENHFYPSTILGNKIDTNAPSITYIFRNGTMTEKYYPVIENTRGQTQLYYEPQFNPITQHEKDVAKIEIITLGPWPTTKVEQTTKLTQVELELATESSEESNDSDQPSSDDKDAVAAIKKDIGEDALNKILNEIETSNTLL